jgi:hypothetical protein
MNPALEKLKARRKALDEKIKAMEKNEREAARERALRILTESGLLDLPEVELAQKLAALKGKAE